ncbi:hypothetical protein [Pontibacter beigongshangensis]|uniref:hypothetical protein n=1 Tax=Pontibacter beigongshangensis TaxID=2574733 RepID=UPI00164EDEEF|nr:hypothetical protein [Pontibacter beigongshangensis]
MIRTFIFGISSLSSGVVIPPGESSLLAATVSKNRYGAAMTFNQNTDTLGTNRYPSEFWAWQHNIAATSFVSRYSGIDDAMNASGRVEKAIYFQTDRWYNPVSQAVELIPDYTATSWTSAGAAAFANAVVGQPKDTRYPNHGQQLYDISNGAYGYDAVSGIGDSNMQELSELVEAEKSQYNEEPFVFSYRNGRNDSPSVYLPYFLGGRNSFFSTSGDSYTAYGAGAGLPNNDTARLDYVDRASATRFADFETGVTPLGIPAGGTYAESLVYLEQELLKTVDSNGFFQDFMHWHTAGTKVRDMYEKVAEVLAPYDVHYAGYDEALRYLWAREMVQAVTVSGNTVNLTWNSFDLPQALTVPVSIRIDVSGTALAGKELQSSVGSILKKSANVFVVEVPYNTDSFTLSETAIPAYVDLAAPTINYSVSGSTLTVTTNKPCRVVLWKHSRGGSDASMPAPTRSNTLGTTHNFAVTSTDLQGDLYIGAITERKQSAVIGPIQHS